MSEPKKNPTSAPSAAPRSAAGAHVEGAPADDDQIEVIDDLHDDFDPEGWMAERLGWRNCDDKNCIQNSRAKTNTP